MSRPWWLLVPVLAGILYAVSFRDFPVIDRQHSVLGDTDAAQFVLLVREFRLNRKFGDEYRFRGRTAEDIAQKHKVHHVLYAAAGHALYLVGRPVVIALGGNERDMVYAVNAVFGAVGLLFLGLLLRALVPGQPIIPYLILAALSLSPWLTASVPESWTFTATLTLMVLWLLVVVRIHWLAAAALLGVLMLSNFTMAALLVVVGMRLVADDPDLRRVVLRSAAAAGVTFGIWLGLLWVLSFWDSSFRPDHFIAYTVWFKNFIGAPVPLTDPYPWLSLSTNLFVNSILSHQSNPLVPQEALKATLLHSPLGTVATLAWVAVALLAVVRLARRLQASLRMPLPEAIRAQPLLYPAVYVAVVTVMLLFLNRHGGFLYSVPVVPLLVLLVAGHLDLSRRREQFLFGAFLVLLVVNNVDQVLEFRSTLATMQ
jgi:hypothetical protein